MRGHRIDLFAFFSSKQVPTLPKWTYDVIPLRSASNGR
jgi:hypothetical protein